MMLLRPMWEEDLEYKEYEPLFQCAADSAGKQKKKAFFVICDTYVTLTDGTGIVHIAPAFGEDDAKVGRHYDLPFVQLVDEKELMGESTPFAGVFVKKGRSVGFKDLDKERRLLLMHRNSSTVILIAGDAIPL